MAVLRPHILRLAAYSTVLALSIHFATLLLLPVDSPLASFIQVSIAAICLGALIGIVIADFQRGGSMMRRIEEELLVIAIFGLFWLSFATILRVYGRAEMNELVSQMNQVPPSTSTAGTTGGAAAPTSRQARQAQHHQMHIPQPATTQSQQQQQRPRQIPLLVVPTPKATNGAVAPDGKANGKVPEATRRSYVIMEEWVYGNGQYPQYGYYGNGHYGYGRYGNGQYANGQHEHGQGQPGQGQQAAV